MPRPFSIAPIPGLFWRHGNQRAREPLSHSRGTQPAGGNIPYAFVADTPNSLAIGVGYRAIARRATINIVAASEAS
jgi:hypothetical protein